MTAGLGVHGQRVRETARHRDSYARAQAPQRNRRGDDSRGDNESSRDANALHFHTGVQNRRANTGLRAQKRESLREILVEGFRYNITIFVPPLSGPINLCPCAFRDADVHGLLAMTTSELRKYLLGRDGFPAIGLGNGKEQVPPLLRCELEAAFIIFGEDRH